MNLQDSINRSEPCFLVEGPRWGDAKFYGKWLLAAGKAETLWQKAIRDPNFADQIEIALVMAVPNFGIGATVMLSQLVKEHASFIIQLDSYEAPEFAMMVELGFFALTGHRYQMVIPSRVNMKKIKAAALKYVRIGDEHGPRPEYFLPTLAYGDARAWQDRLRKMNEAHRHADRRLLLE